MANDLPLQGAEGVTDSTTLHAKMQNCAYCPAEHATMMSVLETKIICQNAHNTVSDSMTFVFDSVDVASFVLFEIPTSLPIVQLMASHNPLNNHNFSASNTLPPLVLTGILRI